MTEEQRCCEGTAKDRRGLRLWERVFLITYGLIISGAIVGYLWKVLS